MAGVSAAPPVETEDRHKYCVYGLHIESPFDFPDLLGSDLAPDLKIELGEFDPPSSPRGSFHFEDDDCWVDYSEIAGIRILISRGQYMTVMPVNERFDPGCVHEFLQGACLAAALLQRKALPLHGNVVDTESGAVALMGSPRAGKSTTSALFVQRGYSLLSDDICAVRFTKSNQPEIQPGIPRVKIRSESLEFLGLADQNLPPVPPGVGKYYWPVGERFQDAPRPIRRLYVLRPTETSEVSIRHLQGAEKLTHLSDQIYRFGARQLAAPFPWLVPELARLADQTSIAMVERPQDAEPDFELIDRLEADLEIAS